MKRPEMIRKKITRKQLGYSSVVYISDFEDGEYMDTKVIINDQLLCVIAGNEIDRFQEALKNVVDKFRI